MLQRIIAAVLIAVGVAGIGLGIASATLWRESETVVASTAYTGDATFLVTDPGVLDLVDDEVTITARVPGEQGVTLAIGRDVDVEGWIGPDVHAAVTGLTDWETLATREIEPEPAEEPTDGEATEEPADTEASEEPADGEEPATDEPVAAADPAGSDMWFAQATGEGTANLTWSDEPGRWRLIAAGTGDDAVAPVLELTWPRVVSTPWLWPGVIAGSLLTLVGLALLVVSLRSRGGSSRRGGARGTTVGAGGTPTTGGTPGTAENGAPDGVSNGTRSPAVGPVRRSTADAPTPTLDEGSPTTSTLTRRQLREQAEAERATREADSRNRPRMRWMTGQIPLVPKDRRPATAAQPTVEPSAAPQASPPASSADAWRKAWGFQKTGGTTADAAQPDPARADDPDAGSTTTGGDR
ncbi:hypothetical protein [Oerskovia flava]|uniref:hypothetical protein n=1 Tax=Oerskovia flava TaxID=2986422 RepID=UPI00223EFAE4|nr:hypothetical protein [Oerskovia sp. JB1-3-2]